MMFRLFSRTGLLLSLVLTGSGCMHCSAYSADHGLGSGLGDDAGLMAGTRSSLKMISDSAVIGLTGRIDGEPAADSLSDRAFVAGLGTFFLADLPATFTLDALRAPRDTVRLFRSTWNDE